MRFNMRNISEGLRVIVAGVLVWSSIFTAPLAFSTTELPDPDRLELIGFRFEDGSLLSFEACAQVRAAAKNGHVSSPGSSDCLGMTPLHVAATKHADDIPALVMAGADLEARMLGGLTPLHLAVREGYWEGLRMLLDFGADPMAVTDNGATLLHTLYSPGCSRCGSGTRLPIAKVLIKAGVQLDDTDDGGATVLHYAVVRKDAAAALAELVGLGADAGVRDINGTPLSFYASLMGNDEAEKLARAYAKNPKGLENKKGLTREMWVELTKPVIEERARDFTMIPVMKVHPVASESGAYGFDSWPDMDDLYRAMHADDATLAELASCAASAAYVCAHACSALLLTGPIYAACVAGCAVIAGAICILLLHSDHSDPPECPFTYEFYELGVMYTVPVPCP